MVLYLGVNQTLVWRRSLVGYSGRFIPGRSLVRVRPPLPNTWPLGQAVKTSPFHGGNMGSIPVGVTKWRHSSVGRALALQARCHRFKSYCLHQKKKASQTTCFSFLFFALVLIVIASSFFGAFYLLLQSILFHIGFLLRFVELCTMLEYQGKKEHHHACSK